MFWGVLDACLDKASFMGSIEQKGAVFQVLDIPKATPGFFASDNLASIAFDSMQAAIASE